MAIQFGKNSTRTSGNTSPITTASFTINNDERVLVLMLNVASATSRAGGAPTFGGQTMTQASSTQKAAASPEASAELWYLLDPPIGSNTASIPNTGTLTIFYTLATAKLSSQAGSGGVSGHAKFDGANGSNNTSTNPTPGAVTTTTERSIGFAIIAGGAQTWAPSAQVGTAIANTDDGSTGGGEQYILLTGPQSHTLSWTFGTSDDWGAVSAYFYEITPPVLNNYQSIKAASGVSVTELIR